ncbi:MAG: response regulator [Magnetococcales bacterium]|nr:response regulator [Magnetococcales bacterium]
MDEPVTGTILVVDDTQEYLHYLAGILQDAGYTVHLARTAAAALAFCQFVIPDLVLLDVKLPDMNGFDVCRQLKAMHATVNLPILFMSGLTDTTYKVKGFKVGGVDFINKPFVLQEVLVRVETHLALSRSLLETVEKNTALAQEIECRKQQEAREQKQAHDALRLSESRFQIAFETAAHGMALVSPTGRWLAVNPALCTILGYAEPELLATDFQSITHPDDLHINQAYLQQLLAGTIAHFHSEKRYLRKDGHVVWVLLSVAMVRDVAGLPVHFVTQVLDISARKAADVALLSTKNQLEMQIDCINRIQRLFIEENDPAVVFDTLLVEILRLTASTHGFIDKVRRDAQGAIYLQTLAISTAAGGQAGKMRDAQNHAGSHFTHLRNGYSDQILTGQFVIANALHEDPQGCHLPPGHPPIQAFLGIPIKRGEEIVGVLGLANRPAGYDLALIAYLEPMLSACAHIIEGYRNLKKRVAVEKSLRRANTLLIQEIKEREQTQAALQQERDKLREITATLAEGLYVLDREGVITLINPTALTILGWREAEVLGHSSHALFHHTRPDGSPYPAEACLLREVLNHGQVITADEEWFWRRDGSRLPVAIIAAPIRRAGEICGVVVSFRDISHYKQIEAELSQAKQRAEAAAQAKSDFLSTMSHEIRTPMNGLLGMADLLLRTPLTKQQHHYVQTIHRSGRTLLRIINDILDLSKIQAGQMRLELLQFDLDEVIHDIIDMFAEHIKNKGLAMQATLCDGVPLHLLGDPHRLSQILFNLLGNASKFTEEGSIQLSVAVTEERAVDVLLCFRVTDTGIGIAPEYQKQMFQPFSQEDSSISRRFGGTGLGLTITQKLVSMMDGDLGVDSVPGQGSTFWFTARFGKQQEKDRKELLIWQTTQQPPTADNVQFAGRVLLVEDNQVNQEVAVATLEIFGCQVTVACNGQRALTLAREASPPFDAIFMDCEMPILNGFAATRRLRQWESETGQPHTPIIALTAHVLEQSRQQCQEAGMDDYLRKPFSQADLGATLSRWLPRVNDTTAEPTPPGTPSSDAGQDIVCYNGDGVALPSAAILDQTALGHILELARTGNQGLLGQMTEHYLTQTPVLLAELQQAMERHDHEAIRVAAHTLKSSSLTMGAVRLAELGQAMETDHADLIRLGQRLRSSAAAFAAVRQALRDLCRAQQEGKPQA